MKELIESELQRCENLAQAYWDLIKEAVERKDLTRLINAERLTRTINFIYC